DNQLPASLVSGFGIAGLSLPHLSQTTVADALQDKTPQMGSVTPQNTIIPEPPSSSGSVLKWIIIVVVLVLIAWWFLGRNKAGNQTVTYLEDSLVTQSQKDTLSVLANRAGEAVAGSLNEAGDWVYNLGANKTIKLPDGASLAVGENSAESKLIS